MHELNANYRSEAITFILGALEHFKEIISKENVSFNQSQQSRLDEIKVSSDQKRALVKNAKKVADQALRIFDIIRENKCLNSTEIKNHMKCDYNKSFLIIKNLVHYGLIDVREPDRKGKGWRFSKTCNFQDEKLLSILVKAFKRPFSKRSLKLSVCCDLFEDDLE